MNTPKIPETAKCQKRLKSDGGSPPERSNLAGLVRAATEKAGRRKGSSSFVVYLIVTAVVVVAFAFLGWGLVRARRKVIKLSYELRKKKEEQKSIAQQCLFAKEKAKIEASKARVKTLEKGIQKLRKKLRDQDEHHKKRLRAIDEATSWEDLGL